jgi:aromatic ring-cleaving dioxygenase
MGDIPFHAHIYFTTESRETAAQLRTQFQSMPDIKFVGRMAEGPAGPHPIPQYEVHFTEEARDAVIALIKPTGLRALVHPLTQDDLADHTSLGHWIGEPVELDISVLDPVGHNQGVPRFGVSDF